MMLSNRHLPLSAINQASTIIVGDPLAYNGTTSEGTVLDLEGGQ